MKCAAIGVRMHSGWGALVAVSNSAGTVQVIERRRVAIITPGTPGANQPYHFAENLELLEAEEVLPAWELFCGFKTSRLGRCPELGKQTAWSPISCRRCLPMWPRVARYRLFPKILASHALIHAAEGEFFREVFSGKHARGLDLSVMRGSRA